MTATRRAYLELHLAVFLYGFTAILGDLISLSATVLVWWRVLITSISLFFLIKFGKTLKGIPKRLLWEYIGIGVLIADTGYELYAACETLRDINQLYIDLDIDDAVAAEGLHEVCSPNLPDADQVWADVVANTGLWWDTLLDSGAGEQ